MKSILSILSFLIIINQGFAQSFRYIKLIEIADAYYNNNNFYEASNYFKKAYKYKESEGVALKTAICEAKLSHREVAKHWFTLYQSFNIQLASDSIYYAIFKRYKPTTKLDSIDVSIVNLHEINTEFHEIAPSFFNKDLIYSSSQTTPLTREIDGSTGENFFNFYISKMKDEQYDAGVKFRISINSQGNDVGITFDTIQKEVMFAQSETSNCNFNKKQIYRLYRGSSENNFLKKFESFVWKDSCYSIAQPFIHASGNIFLFASDKPGGFGGSDLYISYRLDNGWSVPENLGKEINTSGNEYYPFVDNVGNLYFSSNQYKGFGGYDILKAKPTKKGWKNPDVLPYPINTDHHEMSIILNPKNNQMGIICSDRPNGKGGFDLYSIKLNALFFK